MLSMIKMNSLTFVIDNIKDLVKQILSYTTLNASVGVFPSNDLIGVLSDVIVLLNTSCFDK